MYYSKTITSIDQAVDLHEKEGYVVKLTGSIYHKVSL